MFLRNWYNMLMSTFYGFTQSSGTYGDACVLMKSIDGSTFYSYNYFDLKAPKSSSTLLNDGIVFGTGDTAVTFDDYSMDNIISSGITKTNLCYVGKTGLLIPNWDSTNKKWVYEYSCDIINTGSSSITIKEVGFMSQQCLYYREVLETPFTIPSGERYCYSQKFDFQFPN